MVRPAGWCGVSEPRNATEHDSAWDRLKRGVCPNCAEKGPHFIPPSFGESGFYTCDARPSVEQEDAP